MAHSASSSAPWVFKENFNVTVAWRRAAAPGLFSTTAWASRVSCTTWRLQPPPPLHLHRLDFSVPQRGGSRKPLMLRLSIAQKVAVGISVAQVGCEQLLLPHLQRRLFLCCFQQELVPAATGYSHQPQLPGANEGLLHAATWRLHPHPSIMDIDSFSVNERLILKFSQMCC